MLKLRLIKQIVVFALMTWITLQATAKPGAAITLLGESVYQLQAHNNHQLELKFRVPAVAGELQLDIRSDDNIRLVKPTPTQNFPLNGEVTELPLSIEVSTGEEGKYYLMFHFILTREDGRQEARTTGIRLQVGESKPGLQKQSLSPTIKSLPAEEKIY